MSQHKTISTRWKEWAQAEPSWAYSALLCFALVFLGLIIHLGVLSGPIRQWGLIVVLIGDSGAIGITAYRKQWWWCSFFLFITAGVIGWELASYFS